MSWPEVKLADCARIFSGATPRTNVTEYWDGDIPWITPKDLGRYESRYIASTEKNITKSGFLSCSTNLLPIGSVMLSSRAPIGHVAINSVSMCTNQGFKSIVPDKEKLDADYLYFWLKSQKNFLQSLGVGATFKEISKAIVENIKIPLPPLDEQRRIAAILDKADELRQKRKQTIAKLDELVQATFIDMFGDPVTNPKGWEIVKIKEIVNDFLGGKNVECPTQSDSKYKILKVSAVTSKIYKPDECKPAPSGFSPSSTAIVAQGDLLFSRANTTQLVAATAYVWETPENIVLPDKIWKFSLKQDSTDLKIYLWNLFKNVEFRNEVTKLSSGTSGSMKNISKGKLYDFSIPMPPLEMQQDFLKFILCAQEMSKTHRQSLSQLEAIFQSLQHQAFSGQLTPT